MPSASRNLRPHEELHARLFAWCCEKARTLGTISRSEHPSFRASQIQRQLAGQARALLQYWTAHVAIFQTVQGDKQMLEPSIKKILCPTDFSEPSQYATRFAIALGGKLGASIFVVHVHHPILPLASTLETSGPWVYPDLLERLAQAAQQSLSQWLERFSDANVPLKGLVVEGAPTHQVIQKTAEEVGAQLLVIGTHGRTGLTRFLLGSVAEKVIRCSDIPVTAVPAPAPITETDEDASLSRSGRREQTALEA
jgi:universal stress protein A